MSNSPLAVCVLPQNAENMTRTVSYPDYIYEVLDHAGVCYARVSVDQLQGSLPDIRVLLTVGNAKLSDTLTNLLPEWVASGGAWIAISGVCGLAELFGVELEPASFSSWGGGPGTLGEGYMRRCSNHPIVSNVGLPLHYFNGVPARVDGGTVLAGVLDAHQRQTDRAAVVEMLHGPGECILITPDVTGTIVRIQQGIGAVTRDGVSAPDGSAPVCDLVLKSGDGMSLDWIFDRQPVDTIPGLSVFTEPIADYWRELVLRAIFHACERREIKLPVLWLYPRNLPAIAHLSHDSDGNNVEDGSAMLDVVNSLGIHSSWCTIAPGYGPELTEKIRLGGHELAMHYDSMTDGFPWSEDQFEAQWKQLCEIFDAKPVTNKNHYLRWEGDVDVLEWCEKRGIQLDESKGASKTGEAGYNFGTCHPYFAVRMDGSIVNVLELATITQDFEIFIPQAIFEFFLRATIRHHGIMHLLFHPAHIRKPNVAPALRHAVVEARRSGMEWWTGAQINKWERARRSVKWQVCAEGGECGVTLAADEALPGATVLWLVAKDTPGAVARWGFHFIPTIVDIEAGQALELRPQTEAQA